MLRELRLLIAEWLMNAIITIMPEGKEKTEFAILIPEYMQARIVEVQG